MASLDSSILSRHFDSVVMLTWSDWKAEPRSNRYHYATRFARYMPVLFVQPDLSSRRCVSEPTEIPGIDIVHVWRRYDEKQRALLALELATRRIRRPLIWAYNAYFRRYISNVFSPLKVYHATEDYFVEGGTGNPVVVAALRNTLNSFDLVVSVSEGVAASYRDAAGYRGRMLILENGCDFAFWSNRNENQQPILDKDKRIAIYQGGINRRLDWRLLLDLVKRTPRWEYWFCGRNQEDLESFKELLGHPNVRYWGELPLEQVRNLASQATIGIIPFVQDEYIKISFPLKAYEYVACDLPVVSVPILALQKNRELFYFASDAESFAFAMNKAATERHDPGAARNRQTVAALNDYDRRFEALERELLEAREEASSRRAGPANVLVVYDINSTHVKTLLDHLTSFQAFSMHSVFYATGTGASKCRVDLSIFDAIVIHYSVRLSLSNHLSNSFADAISRYEGLKIAFIQDEYDTVETTRSWLERLGVQVVYTCVPLDNIATVYPVDRFRGVEFVPTLTGYVPYTETSAPRPLSERQIYIGYRGRRLPYWYGDLGYEKEMIGRVVRQCCEAKGVPVDIEWDDSKRIYGARWMEFLSGCRATLGTESGSNILDEYGEIKASVEEALRKDPALTYENAKRTILRGMEGRIRMNQISPKIFEAIATRTALILFEGEYSGIVLPGIHYIPLKRDLSNLDEVLAKLKNDSYLLALTERAYRDVIASGKYGYRAFVGAFDRHLTERVRPARSQAMAVLYAARRSGETWQMAHPKGSIVDMTTSAPLVLSDLPVRSRASLALAVQKTVLTVQPIWQAIPGPMRRALWPIVGVMLRLARKSGISI